eukprot:1242275-Rhodomonas_salina.2
MSFSICGCIEVLTIRLKRKPEYARGENCKVRVRARQPSLRQHRKALKRRDLHISNPLPCNNSKRLKNNASKNI